MSTYHAFVNPASGFPSLQTLKRALVERRLLDHFEGHGGPFIPAPVDGGPLHEQVHAVKGPGKVAIWNVLEDRIPDDWTKAPITFEEPLAWATLDASLARYVFKSAPFTSLRQLAVIMDVCEPTVYNKARDWKLRIQNWSETL